MSRGENLSWAGRDLLNRRQFFGNAGTGLGAIALAGLLKNEGLLAQQNSTGSQHVEIDGADQSPIDPVIDSSQPFAARAPHFAAKAEQVLVIFCSGALSHLESWDYKTSLIKYHDQPQPDAPKVTFQSPPGNLHRPIYEFKPRGQSGKMISDMLPHLAELADEMCFIHSMTSKTNTHGPGENFMSTGSNLDGFPSMGAWTTYALGSENAELPAFVAIPDPRGVPQSAANNWGPGFLPAAFQGTSFNANQPIRHLQMPSGKTAEREKNSRDLLSRLNAKHLEKFPGDSQLAARIASYELAARMQLSVPKIMDLSSETQATLDAYGATDAENPLKAGFARNCILARRLIEQGVRCVQLFNGAYAMGEGVGNWDGHKTLKTQYAVHAPILDQPAAALLADLKQRGLLEKTLVVWCTEFGRQPTFQTGASGRDHNPSGFTCWLAGAGVKAPFTYGATDEFGYKAIDQVTTVYDFHATILHLLGLNHERLTYYHNGFRRRLTDVHGHVLHDILA
jgi:Protein of unknown function (DUF1501)